MINRYIHSFTCCFPDPETEKDSLAALIPDIPKRAARRMSSMGKQIHHVLAGIDLDLQTSLIYGTKYTEAVALESYLESIPFASPTAFQTSIHPGGIEQALIMNKQEVGALFPLAGDETLFLQMLQTAFTCTTPKVVLTGGEESGSWLRDFNLAYERCFAFSLGLSSDSSLSIGQIDWQSEFNLENPVVPTMESIVKSMQASERLTIGSPDHGQFEISWK